MSTFNCHLKFTFNQIFVLHVFMIVLILNSIFHKIKNTMKDVKLFTHVAVDELVCLLC